MTVEWYKRSEVDDPFKLCIKQIESYEKLVSDNEESQKTEDNEKSYEDGESYEHKESKYIEES